MERRAVSLWLLSCFNRSIRIEILSTLVESILFSYALNNFHGLHNKFYMLQAIFSATFGLWQFRLEIICSLAVSIRPPDGVLLAPAALAARSLRRLASLLEL